MVNSKIVMTRISSTLRWTTRTLISISPVVPNATVKRSQSISVHDLIQKIESHPQKEAIQKDLEKHCPFNPFSAKSKDAIMAAGNTELCEIINVEPKLQCKACLKHCSTGIIYCTCGHLMTDDSAENRKYRYVLHPELLH